MVLDTSPKAGSEVEVDSPVKIFVSRERTTDTVTLPNVVGQSLDEAKYTLESLGFEVDYEYNEKVDKEKDTVMAQSPGYDVEYKTGEKVKLIVAKGLDKTRTCTLNIDLPADVEREVFIRVTVDGVVNEEYSQNVIPKYNSTYKVKLTAEGTIYVQVSLNENLYREYQIDFTKGEIVNSAKYDFVQDSTLPTEPETDTEPETSTETEPETTDQTDPYYDPYNPW